MFKINKKVEYALIALRHLHDLGPNGLSPVSEICEKYKCPYNTTAKVLQNLCNAHVVQSVQGLKGGYQLIGDLRSISFFQLTELIEGKSFEDVCMSSKGPCEMIDTCNIVNPIKKLNIKLVEFFQKLSIAELLNESASTITGISVLREKNEDSRIA